MTTIRLDAHKPEFHRAAPPQLPVRVATTANITIATALNAGDTIDGVTLAAGDRVLVKDQSSGLQNGIYDAGATPARSFDMLEGVAAYGAVIYVVAGTANGGKQFRNTNSSVPTIDTDALTFSSMASADLSGIDFLVGTATGLLSAEIVAGTSPGGELGGTWASPTVDATHSGSAHVTAHSGLTGLTSGDDHTQYVENADDVGVAINIDNGASVITTGIKAAFKFPRAGHFRSSPGIIAPRESGSIVFDIWVRNGALPTVTQSITASAKPTLTTSQFNDTASAMTSWVTAFGAGDWCVINVDSVTSLTLAILYLPIDWT